MTNNKGIKWLKHHPHDLCTRQKIEDIWMVINKPNSTALICNMYEYSVAYSCRYHQNMPLTFLPTYSYTSYHTYILYTKIAPFFLNSFLYLDNTENKYD